MTLEHDDIAELLGVYAVNAIDADERAQIEAHLLECPRCRSEVDDHREVVALLANTGSSAPEGVWTRIESALVETPPAFDLGLIGVRSEATPPTVADESDRALAPVVELAARRRAPVALSAAAAVAALVLGLFVGSLVGSDSDDNPVEVVSSLDEAARSAMNDSTSTRIAMVATDGSATVDAVLTEDGHGFLVGTTLASLDVDLAYQLWGIRDGVAVSLGVLGNAPSVVAFPVTTDFDALALTVEQAGGVVSSVEPPAYVGEIT